MALLGLHAPPAFRVPRWCGESPRMPQGRDGMPGECGAGAATALQPPAPVESSAEASTQGVDRIHSSPRCWQCRIHTSKLFLHRHSLSRYAAVQRCSNYEIIEKP